MTVMDDLVTWLRDQLDEDEAEANEALKRQTTQRRMIHGRMTDVPNQPMPEWRRSVWPPARVLAEIDAKRRILDLRDAERAALTRAGYGDAASPALRALDDVIRLLAQPYAGRDGWREQWRP